MAAKLAIRALYAAIMMVFLSGSTPASACGGGCEYPTPATPKPPTIPGTGGGSRPPTCPVNLIKIAVCSPLLGGTVGPDCCPLLGLLGVDVEICLCLALDINVLGLIDINIPKLDIIASIMTSCGLTPRPNFTCP